MTQSILSHDHLTALCRELIREVDSHRRYLLREAGYCDQDGGAGSAGRMREAAGKLKALTDDTERKLQ